MDGQSLRAAREAQGWSISELARRAGLNRDTISDLEKRGATPQASTMQKLNAVLNPPSSRQFEVAVVFERRQVFRVEADSASEALELWRDQEPVFEEPESMERFSVRRVDA